MATRNSKRRPPLPTVFRTTSPLLTSGVPASPTNTPFENETRVLSLDWKKQALSSATSSPNLKLLLRDRPVFKCPSCGLANQFVPTCLICRTSDAEAAEAFFKSIPTRVRRISAPGKAAPSLKAHVNLRDREAAETEPRISTDSGTSTLPPVTPKDGDAFPTELPSTCPMEHPKLAQFRPKKQVQPPRSTPPISAPPSLRHRGRIARTAAGVVCLSPTVANPLPPKKPQSSTLGTQGKKRSVHFRPSLPPPPPTPIDPVHAIILAANPAISARELRSKEFERKRLDDPLYGAPPDWERRRASLGGRMSADGLRNSDSMPSIRWSMDGLPATVGRSSTRPEIDMGSPKSTASRRLSHPSRAVVMAARADLAQRVSTPTLTHSRGKSLPEVGSGRFSSTLSRSSQSPLAPTTSRSPRPSITQSIPFASYALPRPSTSSLSNRRSSTSSKPRTSISSLASNWIPSSKPRLSTHSARDWGILYEEVPAPPPSPRLGVGLKRSISTFFGKVRTKLAS